MCDDAGIISSGTGFFFETDNAWYVVTNWHNVTGRHFQTHKALSSMSRVPTRLIARISSYLGEEDDSFIIKPFEIPLYDQGRSRWLEHDLHGSLYDIVAIPWTKPESCPSFMHNAANLISSDNIPVYPGGVVFIIGFPMAISVGFGLPLWKSGYVASEPHYDITLNANLQSSGGLEGGHRIPAFFIDAQTRSGMSGSPVFVRYFGAWDMNSPYEPINFDEPGFWERNDVAMFGSTGTQFVGCYSGHVFSREKEAILGLCWKREIIETVCKNGKSGRFHVDYGYKGMS